MWSTDYTFADWYMSVKRTVNYTNGYAVIDPVSLIILISSNLINLTIRSFQCEFVSSKKIYHRTNNPNLATPLRRQKEDYWIRELETATLYM